MSLSLDSKPLRLKPEPEAPTCLFKDYAFEKDFENDFLSFPHPLAQNFFSKMKSI